MADVEDLKPAHDLPGFPFVPVMVGGGLRVAHGAEQPLGKNQVTALDIESASIERGESVFPHVNVPDKPARVEGESAVLEMGIERCHAIPA